MAPLQHHPNEGMDGVMMEVSGDDISLGGADDVVEDDVFATTTTAFTTNHHTTASPSSSVLPPSFSNTKIKTKKRVQWSHILQHVREYSLCVGDHPMCSDKLPLQLDWQYHDAPCCPLVNNNAILSIPTRTAAYMFPRRMSYHEKAQRLQLVSLYTLDIIQSEELELTARRLQEEQAQGEHKEYDLMEWETDYNDDIMTMGLDLDHSYLEENETGWLWNDKMLLQDVSNFDWSVFWGEHPSSSSASS